MMKECFILVAPYRLPLFFSVNIFDRSLGWLENTKKVIAAYMLITLEGIEIA